MTGVGSVQLSGGNFVVDGVKMDLGTLMMQLNLDRTQAIDQQIADQMSQISDRNKKLRQLNELMAAMRKLKAEGSDDDDFNQGNVTIDGQTKTLWRTDDNWAKEFGITWTDINGNDDRKTRDSQWDTNIEAVKGKIDSLNSDSQLDMIRLQNLIDKRNQAFQLATDMVKKDAQAKDGIIRNIGQ